MNIPSPTRSVGLLMARGGSKRIPRKNVRLFAGKPAFLWPLATMLDSGLFAKVRVSSEDAEILRLARERGAETPFVRPQALANDHATTFMVLQHAIKVMANSGEYFSSLCCAYGTSVFLTDRYLADAANLLKNDETEVVMAACRFEHPVERGFVIEDDMARFTNRWAVNERTQDLVPHYHDVGLLYWVKTHIFDSAAPDRHFSDYKVKPLLLPRGEVTDIDDEDDWAWAEERFALRLRSRRVEGERKDLL